jgi:hypothetical protein
MPAMHKKIKGIATWCRSTFGRLPDRHCEGSWATHAWASHALAEAGEMPMFRKISSRVFSL